MGQRGQLDRVPVAHSGPILSLDWYAVPTTTMQNSGGSFGGMSVFNEGTTLGSTSNSSASSGGWIVSGGLDRTVKVWDLTVNVSRLSHTPTYTLSTSFPVHRVLWRPSFECEVAVVSNAGFGTSFGQDLLNPGESRPDTADQTTVGQSGTGQTQSVSDARDAVEIWDVRRGFIAKWAVGESTVEGGVTGIVYPQRR